MAIYVGFYNADPTYAEESARRNRAEGPGPEPSFVERVRALPGKLPQGCAMLGSYGTMANDRPSVMLVEASDPAQLQFITQYYQGFLTFDWVPVVVVGGNAAEREAWANQAQSTAAAAR